MIGSSVLDVDNSLLHTRNIFSIANLAERYLRLAGVDSTDRLLIQVPQVRFYRNTEGASRRRRQQLRIRMDRQNSVIVDICPVRDKQQVQTLELPHYDYPRMATYKRYYAYMVALRRPSCRQPFLNRR